MKRSTQLKKLTHNPIWDVIVIGGGANGLGIALDAVTRGFKTLLLEANDFAKGTSSRSTKLIHGGLRYLAQGNIGLVKEALHERNLLAKNAAHLVKNQSFVIPNYDWWHRSFYKVGLNVYDVLASKANLDKAKCINKNETILLLPTVNQKNLKNGVKYYDYQFDDARLAVNLAQTIINYGGTVINYFKVTDLIKNEKNKIIGVKAQGFLTSKIYDIRSRVVINATGVFSDDILSLDNPKHKKTIVPSQGIHVVLDKSFLPGDNALMIPKTSGGRVLFAVPWHKKVIVGTTDTLIKQPSYEPKALDQEIDFILETASDYLNKKPTKNDVLSVFAGIRPLSAIKSQNKTTKDILRNHEISVSESGLISVIGGKWTTYRKIAGDVINKAIEVHHLLDSPCMTENLSIHGNKSTTDNERNNHLHIYGTDASLINKLIKVRPEFAEKIHRNYDYTVAEVIWAVHNEMALTVEDVLARRIRLLFLDARAAIDSAEKVATIMAHEHGHDNKWIEKQTQDFIGVAKNYLLVNYNAS